MKSRNITIALTVTDESVGTLRKTLDFDMANIQTEKIKALQKHRESYRCDHKNEEKALQKRTVKMGGIQYVYQCLRCGGSASNHHSRENAIEMNGGIEPPPFNDELPERWKRESKEGEKRIIGHFPVCQPDARHALSEIALISGLWIQDQLRCQSLHQDDSKPKSYRNRASRNVRGGGLRLTTNCG